MVSSRKLRERWLETGDSLLAFTPELAASVPIPDSARLFLVECGLPNDAAPFLSFGNRRVASLQPIRDVWPAPESVPECWCIGANGSGDPICILADGRIVSLNHDRDFAVELISSSLEALLELLLAYRQAVATAQAVGGPDAYLDNRIPRDVQDWFHAELSRIDPIAARGPSLWRSELDAWRMGSL
jgi:hypothetical protein